LIDFSTKNYNEYDFNYVMNQGWSDYNELFGNDIANYVLYSKLFLEDIDSPEGKAYNYYTKIIKEI
jgi:hypothetical protein